MLFCYQAINKDIKLSSFKSSENTQKKECEPDSTVSNNQFFSVTLNELARKARKRVILCFREAVDSKD